MNAGAVPLTTEQLAGVMNHEARGGAFVMKVATARIFGLISNAQGKYELTDIGFGIVDKDEKRQRAARKDAFLSVPLYRKIYDEFKGKQLPPRPQGLENAFIKFGVAVKQKTAARLAFDKSAQQAGFFATGNDRLIEPIIAGAPMTARATPAEDAVAGNGAATGRSAAKVADVDAGGRHPFIQGLLDTLPEPGTNWTVEGRAKWLSAANNIFDLIYHGTGEIEIVAKPAPDKQ